MLQRAGPAADGDEGGGGGGEDGGDAGLRVLLFGAARVTRRLGAGTASTTTLLRPGDHFGSIELLHRGLRAATIRANASSRARSSSDSICATSAPRARDSASPC